MALPSKKRTKSSKRTRAAHFALKKATLISCKGCEKKIFLHHACPFCGTYKGKTI